MLIAFFFQFVNDLFVPRVLENLVKFLELAG